MYFMFPTFSTFSQSFLNSNNYSLFSLYSISLQMLVWPLSVAVQDAGGAPKLFLTPPHLCLPPFCFCCIEGRKWASWELGQPQFNEQRSCTLFLYVVNFAGSVLQMYVLFLSESQGFYIFNVKGIRLTKLMTIVKFIHENCDWKTTQFPHTSAFLREMPWFM